MFGAASLLKSSEKALNTSIVNSIKNMEEQLTEHNRELELAWEYAEHTGVSIFLTGKAGTGKTTFLKTLRQRSAKSMVVVAPTGVDRKSVV